MSSTRELKIVIPVPDAAPEIARWLWAMEETRRGLLRAVDALDQRTLDWRGLSGTDNSIGSLLYHVALVEMSWLYEDLLLEPRPRDISELFPATDRAADGRLLQVVGESLERHTERLQLTRSHFLERMIGMTAADWDTVREPPGVTYTCSPAWVVFHLVEHEAGHLFQVREITRRWRDATRPRL